MQFIYIFLIEVGAQEARKKDLLSSRILTFSGRHKLRVTINQENKMVSHKNVAFSPKEGTRIGIGQGKSTDRKVLECEIRHAQLNEQQYQCGKDIDVGYQFCKYQVIHNGT